MHSKGHSSYSCPGKIIKMNEVFRSCASLIARKTTINYLLKAGNQRSEMTKKYYLLLLIELGVLKALEGFLFFVSAYLQKIFNVISTCLKFM